MAETNTQTNTTTQTTTDPAQTAQNAQEAAPASAEGNDTPKQENTSQSAAQPPEKAFTQDELNRILADRLKSERDRWEKKAADEKAEAERVAKMTADEKAKHEQEKREREFAQREATLQRKERTATARDLLAEKGAPAALLGAVDVSSDEAVAPSVEAIVKAFNSAVSAEVAKKLAGAPPKTSSPAKADPFREGLGV